MNIVLIGPVYPYRGGIAHHTLMLARALTKRHTVLTVSFKRQYPRWLYPGHTDQDPSLDTFSWPAEYLLDPFNPLTWRRTAEHIRRFNPQIVVFQWWTTLWSPAFGTLARMLRAKGVPVQFLVHNVLPHEPRKLDGLLARFALQHGSSFVAQSETEYERLRAIVPGAAAVICPLPLFDVLAAHPVSKSHARCRLGLTPGKPVILFFGFVRAYKGLRYLIDALARLRDSGHEMVLVIAGEFWENPAEYLRQIVERQLERNVVIHNRYIPNEEIGLFFSAADVVAAPYVGGTQSAAVQLALAFAQPVVLTSNVAGSAFMAEWGERVTVVAPRDASALAEGLLRSTESADAADRPPRPELLRADWSCIMASIESSMVHGSEGRALHVSP